MIQHHLGGFRFVLLCNYRAKELELNVSPFYVEILSNWELLKKIFSESNPGTIDPREVIIWNSSELKIGGKAIFHNSWFDAGIEKVKHLLNANSGEFMTQGLRRPT